MIERHRPLSAGSFSSASLALLLLVVHGCAEFHIPDPAVLYAAFGDSATAGPSPRDYPDALRARLGLMPEAFANEGHGGETSEEVLDRLTSLLAADIFPNARVLLYWAGGTDIVAFIRENDLLLLASPDDADYPLEAELQQRLDRTQANVESAIAAGRTAGLTVYVATYFPIRSDIQSCAALFLPIIFPAQAQAANAYLTRLNQRIRLAAASGATLVDVAAEPTITADSANYHDCNHLSAQGNAIVADLFFAAINGAQH